MSKRTLEADINTTPLVERYLYIRFCEDDGPDGLSHTILSFTDLALGTRVHAFLAELCSNDNVDELDIVIYNFGLAREKRDFGEDDFFDEASLELCAAVGPECVEKPRKKEKMLGCIKNGFMYSVSG